MKGNERGKVITGALGRCLDALAYAEVVGKVCVLYLIEGNIDPVRGARCAVVSAHASLRVAN